MPAKKTAPPKSDMALAADVLSEDLWHLRYLEDIGNNLGQVANSLEYLADTVMLRTIVQHGSEEDRGAALGLLRDWLDSYRRR